MSNNSILQSTLKEYEIPFSLPSNWTWYKWGDLISAYQQGIIRSNRELNSTGVPYLKMADLHSDGSYTINTKVCTDVSSEELVKYKLYKDDFLINVRNSRELVGKTCVIGNLKFDTVFNHMLVRIKHHKDISNVFINALLNTPVMRKFIDRCKKGTTTVIALYQKDLYDIPIPIPDKKTQLSLAEFAANVSRKIDLNNRINAELESIAKTLYDYWFVQFDFPDKNGKPYKSSGGKMVWNVVFKREIPEGWEIKELDEVASLVKDIVIPREVTSETPYIGLEHMPRKSIVLSTWETSVKVDSAKSAFKKNDILFGKIRPYFHKVGVCLTDGITSTDTFVLRAKGIYSEGIILQTVFCDEFVNAATKSSTGSKMPRADWNMLKKYPVIFPPIELRKKYQLLSDNMICQIGKLVSQNQQISKLRDFLLPMLMNGQVKVN